MPHFRNNNPATQTEPETAAAQTAAQFFWEFTPLQLIPKVRHRRNLQRTWSPLTITSYIIPQLYNIINDLIRYLIMFFHLARKRGKYSKITFYIIYYIII